MKYFIFDFGVAVILLGSIAVAGSLGFFARVGSTLTCVLLGLALLMLFSTYRKMANASNPRLLLLAGALACTFLLCWQVVPQLLQRGNP